MSQEAADLAHSSDVCNKQCMGANVITIEGGKYFINIPVPKTGVATGDELQYRSKQTCPYTAASKVFTQEENTFPA